MAIRKWRARSRVALARPRSLSTVVEAAPVCEQELVLACIIAFQRGLGVQGWSAQIYGTRPPHTVVSVWNAYKFGWRTEWGRTNTSLTQVLYMLG